MILCFRSGAGVVDFIKKAEDLTRSLTDSYELVLVANYIEGLEIEPETTFSR